MFKMCLTTIIMHKTWLDDNVHTNSAFHTSPWWIMEVPFANHIMLRPVSSDNIYWFLPLVKFSIVMCPISKKIIQAPTLVSHFSLVVSGP